MEVLCRVLVLVCCGLHLAKTIPVQDPDTSSEDKSQNVVGEPSPDPFVQDADPLLESLAGVFTLDAVKEMTASVTPAHQCDCSSERKTQLEGNMDCLISFWEFQPFSNVNYATFASPLRSECVYYIGFEECFPPAPGVNLAVTSDANALVDGDPNTVWARKIEPGVDTKIIIELDSVYEVSSMDFLSESVLIDVSIQLQLGYDPPFSVARVKPKCQPEDGSFCQDFLLMDRKYHGIDWLDEADDSSELRADKVIVTLHGETSFGSYSTNYFVIRDIRLLAKATKETRKERKELSSTEIIKLLRLHQMNMKKKW